MDEWNAIRLSMIKRNLSQSRHKKYGIVFRYIKKQIPKPIDQINREDIDSLFLWVMSLERTDHTKKCYWYIIKKIIRIFCPEADFSSYKPKFRETIKFPEEIPTIEEIISMIRATESIRDRALLSILYESGARVGEIITLKIKDVFFDSLGCTIIVYGKTGMRRIRLLGSSNIMKIYTEIHPLKDNPDAYIFSHKTKKDNKTMSYTAINKIIKYYAKKVGIQKRMYPYLFRHARATFLAKYLTESELKVYFGWTQASAMAQVYVHLSGRDIDEKILKLNNEISLKV